DERRAGGAAEVVLHLDDERHPGGALRRAPDGAVRKTEAGGQLAADDRPSARRGAAGRSETRAERAADLADTQRLCRELELRCEHQGDVDAVGQAERIRDGELEWERARCSGATLELTRGGVDRKASRKVRGRPLVVSLAARRRQLCVERHRDLTADDRDGRDLELRERARRPATATAVASATATATADGDRELALSLGGPTPRGARRVLVAQVDPERVGAGGRRGAADRPAERERKARRQRAADHRVLIGERRPTAACPTERLAVRLPDGAGRHEEAVVGEADRD